jgi:hypothetical protein
LFSAKTAGACVLDEFPREFFSLFLKRMVWMPFLSPNNVCRWFREAFEGWHRRPERLERCHTEPGFSALIRNAERFIR